MKNKNCRIIAALASATSTLLGTAETQAADAGWKIDTAYLYYSEKDRVQAQEPTLKLQKTFADDSKLNLNLVYDTLSGPSPNGAAPSNQPQTFTGPSGSGSTVIPAGEIPMDENFKDERTQFGTSWDAAISRLWRYNLGFNISAEEDYESLGLSAGLSREYNRKNTTLASGIAYAHDTINPTGGAPEPLSRMLTADAYDSLTGASGANTATANLEMEDEYEDNEEAGNAAEPEEEFEDEDDGENNGKTKDVIDFYIGLTQVINPQTLMQFNVGFNFATGYLNDPYKVVSIVDAITGVPLTVDEGGIIYESRPDTRFKTSLYWDIKHHLDWDDTVTLSYRYMFDDWGIKSHTVDTSYRWNIAQAVYLQPHLRFYKQTAADFFRQSLASNENIPDDISADARLAAFTGLTAGAKLGIRITPHSEFNIRYEKYEQTGEKRDDLIGIQNNLDTFPELDATIVQVGYSIAF